MRHPTFQPAYTVRVSSTQPARRLKHAERREHVATNTNSYAGATKLVALLIDERLKQARDWRTQRAMKSSRSKRH